MKERLEKRLKELKDEFDSGQKMLADLEAKRIELQKTLLRITGAIQVLEEELAKCDDQSSGAEIVEMKSISESGGEGSTEKVSVGN